MTDINPDHDRAKKPLRLTGACFCRSPKYLLKLEDKKDARTTLCHCSSCKKAFGGAFGLTAKVPIHAFRYDGVSVEPTVRYVGDHLTQNVQCKDCD